MPTDVSPFDRPGSLLPHAAGGLSLRHYARPASLRRSSEQPGVIVHDLERWHFYNVRDRRSLTSNSLSSVSATNSARRWASAKYSSDFARLFATNSARAKASYA